MSAPLPSTISTLFQERRRAQAFLANARVVVSQASFTWTERLREFTILGTIYNRLAPSDVKAQLHGALDQTQRVLDRCAPEGELGRRLQAGLVTPQAYANVINAAMGLVSEVLRSTDASRFSADNLWRNVAVPTLQEAKETAEALADRGQSLTTTLAIIAVAVAVVYVTAKVAR